MTVEGESLASKPSAGKLTAPAKGIDGLDASKRMHDYLVNQQRRKEEYWLRKYGKVLSSPAPNKPIRPERSAVTLPPLREKPTRKVVSGKAPMFTANGPIDSFPMRAPANDRRHNPNIPYHPTVLPPISASPSQQNSQANLGSQTAPPSYAQQNQTGQEGHDAGGLTGIGLEASAARLHDSQSYVSHTSAHSMPTRMAPYVPEGPAQPGFKGHVMHMAPNTNVVHQASQPLHEVPSYAHVGPRVASHSKGMRDLQLELTVLKAIKAREDTLDRLRVACEKLDASFGGHAHVVLQGTDPMVRLFYRLVSQLRARTLDCAETLAAWHRRSLTAEPFMYYGSPYMQNIGSDLAFLDKQPFLRSRLQDMPAATDPFLINLTPDSIPIEEVTAADLRRGGHRFTSEALRIRVARKVLATYCGNYGRNSPGALGFVPANGQAVTSIDGVGEGPGRPGSSSSLSSISETQDRAYQEAVKANNEALAPFLESMPPTVDNSYAAAPEPMPSTMEPTPELQPEPEFQADAVQGSSSDAPVEDVEEATRSSGYPSPECSPALPADSRQVDEGADRTEEVEEVADESDAVHAGAQAAFIEAFDEDETQVVDLLDEAAGVDEQVAGQEAQRSGAVMLALSGQLDYELDDGAFIDFAIDAMVASLEEPYSTQLGGHPFSVCGWEIDTQLDGLIDGLDAAYDLGHAQAAHQPQQPPPSSGLQQQDVHLDVCITGDNLHVSLMPSHDQDTGVSISSQPANQDSVMPDATGSGHPGAPGSSSQSDTRPPTRQVRLHLSAVDGQVHADIVPAARPQTSTSQPPIHGTSGDISCRPGSARVRLVLHMSGKEHVQATVEPISSRSGQQPAEHAVDQSPQLGGSIVELLLDVSGDLIRTHMRPASRATAGLPAASLHESGYLSASHDSLGRSSEWGPSRVQLKLDLSGDEVHAQLVPQGVDNKMSKHTSLRTPPLPSLAEEQGAVSSIAQPEASTSKQCPQASVTLKLCFDEAGHVQAQLVSGQRIEHSGTDMAVTRPGTAHVELQLDISSDLVRTRIQTVSRSRPAAHQEGAAQPSVVDVLEAALASGPSPGTSVDIGEVLEDLVGYVEAHSGHSQFS